MLASITFAAADSPGSVFTIWATMGSAVSSSWSRSGSVLAGKTVSGAIFVARMVLVNQMYAALGAVVD